MLNARQLHCLDAMGIDLWRLRGAAEPAREGAPGTADVNGRRVARHHAPASGSGLTIVSTRVQDAGAGEGLFSGPPADLLDAMLGAIGQSRDSVEILALADLDDAGLPTVRSVLEQTWRRVIVVMQEPGDRMLAVPSRLAETPLIDSLHPVHLLNHADDKRRAWEDLKRARSVLDA